MVESGNAVFKTFSRTKESILGANREMCQNVLGNELKVEADRNPVSGALLSTNKSFKLQA